MLSNPATYEYVEPDRFGRQRSLLVGRHSGRAVLRHVLAQLGIDADNELVDELYRVHVAERTGGDSEDLSVIRGRLAAELAVRPAAAVTG